VTEAEAYEALLQHWSTAWAALHPAGPTYVPWITDNEVASSEATWARITMVPTVSSLASIGEATKRMRRGRVAVQLFTAPNVGPGALFRLIGDVRTCLEDTALTVSGERLHLVAASASAPSADGAWFMCVVDVEYWFLETP
jgi:hypothetical protein